MNTASVPIDTALAMRLIATQFSHWAHLPIWPVEFGGWDNRTFHLGDDMTVRLPSGPWYALQVEKEQTWLPKLAPHLPVPIPVPLGKGEPAEGYPWPWSVYRWLEGETATAERIGDLGEFAAAVADFLVALRRIDATGGPAPGKHNFFRGGPLAIYDHETHRALADLEGQFDTKRAAAIWQTALSSEWQNPPVWLHGDIAWGNLLVKDGRLCAVIDFGTSGIGDPSCDLAIAWTMFRGTSRRIFRERLGLDDATWARGRGWTLWKALIVLAGHTGASETERAKSRLVLDAVLNDPA